jgi:hypothetical protein
MNYDKIVFKKEHFHNLIEGTKYYIVFHHLFTMRYTGIFRGFKGKKYINANFTNVSIVLPGHLLENKKETTFFWSNNSNRLYYKIISCKQKIQDKMEKRALHIILRRIIGDEHFSWF